MPIEVLMPALSPTMTEGTLARWLKNEGDMVEAGDVIAEIETDKATMEVEAVDEGKLAKILISEGTENVPVNEMIAVLLEDGEDDSAAEGFSASGASSSEAAPSAEAAPEKTESKATAKSEAPAAGSSKDGGRIFSSPLARRLAKDAGIDLSAVKGTGPRGRVVKADVLKAQKDGVGASASSSAAHTTLPTAIGHAYDADTKVNMFNMPYKELPVNNIQKVTAKRLLESKTTVPHFYLTMDIELDSLLAARKDLNDKANGAYKLSVNDFIVKAVAMALKAYPACNVSWQDNAMHQYLHSDISVAVATPNGLITPIVRAAESKGLAEISNEVKELAGRAREGKLKPEEFQGGSFSISNLGMFGVTEFSAIVNPPQACILAVGAGVQQPVIRGGNVEVATVMKVTLSTDHRAVDGAVGAEFLQILKNYIENPVSMLV
ncbi:MAG: pyruvate dehydrogenase complex dihydrolipoamide acetyltransferase [Alphaproteobacteria bacterium]|nr:pyruvate dehydrogenase complex dihydrolipoamide acetyltransferase [Alphaproteobacteria bacterium]